MGLGGKPAVLVIGFSQSSKTHVKQWTAPLRSRLSAESLPVSVYSVAVLEDAPRLVRPLAIHGMKGDTPQPERDRFLVLVSREKELKQAVSFTEPSAAYVVLLDGQGNIVWRGTGEPTPNLLNTLVERIRSFS